MLNDATWPEQCGADDADVALGCAAEHFLQPSGLERAEAVVHYQHKFTAGIGGALVDQLREVEAAGE